MISSLHLSTTLLFDVSRQWILYLNRCVAALTSESLDAPGFQVPFLLDPIMADMEGGGNTSGQSSLWLLEIWSPGPAVEVAAAASPTPSINGISSTTGEDVRLRLHYDAHLPALSL